MKTPDEIKLKPLSATKMEERVTIAPMSRCGRLALTA